MKNLAFKMWLLNICGRDEALIAEFISGLLYKHNPMAFDLMTEAGHEKHYTEEALRDAAKLVLEQTAVDDGDIKVEL